MKNLVFLFIIVAILSCTSGKHCSTNRIYFKENTDYTKPFSLKGDYCIVEVPGTSLYSDSCNLEFNVFDRRDGHVISDGVIKIYGEDTISLIFGRSSNTKLIKAGRYSIGVWENGYTETKTRLLKLNKNKKIIINFYLGTTMIF